MKRYLVVDDEWFVLEELKEMLQTIRPKSQVLTFSYGREALAAVREKWVDTAFLDIEMAGMSGLELAKQLKEIQPNIRIIFVTGYDHYAVQAFKIHATGYLLKPVVKEDLERELTFIYGEEQRGRIRVQTFGGFDLFVDGIPVKFSRSKAKELLAYLVDCKGASVTTAQACTILFEESKDAASSRVYFRNIVRSLRMALEDAGVGEILLRSFNSLAIVPEAIDCDYYRFLQGDPVAVNRYQQDYLPQYSWAEFRNGALAALEK